MAKPFQRILHFLLQKNVLVITYVIVTLIISAQLLITTHTHPKEGWPTLYNNYVIFQKSFSHLVQGLDLYISYPTEYYDLYKYSPAFALLMAPFSFLPDQIGLSVWNLLNSLVLFSAVFAIPAIGERGKAGILWILLPELVISLQNSQSNALTVGLMVWAWVMMERKQIPFAALLLSLGVMIKLFPLLGFLLFLFYPDKLKALFWSCCWLFLLTALPFLAVGFDQLILLYKSWLHLLGNDHTVSAGLSVFGWLEGWFGASVNKNILLLIGLVLLLLPLIKIVYPNGNKIAVLLYLAYLLIWIVIFNHKAESPTFIIAMTGIGLWFSNVKKNWYNVAVFIFAFLFVSISPTDLVPEVWRNGWIKNGVWKVVPCILIFLLLLMKLILPDKSGKHFKSKYPEKLIRHV